MLQYSRDPLTSPGVVQGRVPSYTQRGQEWELPNSLCMRLQPTPGKFQPLSAAAAQQAPGVLLQTGLLQEEPAGAPWWQLSGSNPCAAQPCCAQRPSKPSVNYVILRVDLKYAKGCTLVEHASPQLVSTLLSEAKAEGNLGMPAPQLQAPTPQPQQTGARL